MLGRQSRTPKCHREHMNARKNLDPNRRRKIDFTQLAAANPMLSERYVGGFVECWAVRTKCYNAGAASHWVSARFTGIRGRPRHELWISNFPKMSGTEVQKLENTIGHNVITEHAALAFAIAGINQMRDLQIREVCLIGERTDYWLRQKDGTRVGALEASGTVVSRSRSLFARKRKQTLKNRTAPTAYVGVFSFQEGKGHFCRVR